MNNKIFTFSLKNIAIILLVAIFFVADRFLKILALTRADNNPIPLLGKFFSFNFTANHYMAFSLPLGGQVLNILIIVAILLLLSFIFYLTLNKNEQKPLILPLTIILIGAISNILDRVSNGYVIDYLDLHYFTVFNLADVMISLGTLFIIFKALKKEYVQR